MRMEQVWDQLGFMNKRKLPGPRGELQLVENRPGETTQLLLMHGVLRDWRSFYPLYPSLNQSQHSVAALDFRGHGGSSKASPNYRVVDYVEDAVAVLRTLHQPVVLYGHSLGAMVAFAAAVHVPEKVRSVVMEDPPLETMGGRLSDTSLHQYFSGVEQCVLRAAPDEDALFEDFSNIVVGKKLDGMPLRVRDQRDETSRRFSVSCLITTDPEVMRPIVAGDWLAGFGWPDMIESLQCNVHLLQSDGNCGGMLSDQDTTPFTRTLGERCQLIKFPEVGHSIHWQAPQSILDLLDRLI